VTRTVLIVDNDPSTGELIADVLRDMGYTATIASTLADGIALADARRPDLVIIDPTLRDGDGRELARRAQSQGARLVITSARHDALAIARGLGMPLVAKPFSVDEFRAAIAAVDGPDRTARPP
jgi:DNA-binding response OmpR family regulator